MIKKLIKSLLGEKNTDTLRRIKYSFSAAKATWQNFNATQSHKDRLNLSLLMSIHSLEKAMVIGSTKSLSAFKYDRLISDMSSLIHMGVSPNDFTIAVSASVIHSALDTLSGHDDEKSWLSSLVSQYNIPMNLRGGIEVIPSTEILRHTDFDFHAFVSSRHSVRKFKDKIIPREVIYDIVREALYCPSACNRQPFNVYFSEDKETIARIICAVPDQFIAGGFHDCLIVTCDRALLNQNETDDQEYINGGIFLGYMAISIHAHGLGACICQLLRKDRRQEKIKREFGIKDSEIIAGFIAFGELEDDVICACSQRRATEDVALCLDD